MAMYTDEESRVIDAIKAKIPTIVIDETDYGLTVAVGAFWPLDGSLGASKQRGRHGVLLWGWDGDGRIIGNPVTLADVDRVCEALTSGARASYERINGVDA